MTRINSAPIVAAALSGLVVGVVLTLIVTGSMSSSSSKGLPTVIPATPVVARQAHLVDKIKRVVATGLGPGSSNPKVSRLVRVQAIPRPAATATPYGTGPGTTYDAVNIVFRLNDHPLGKSWRLRAAQGDVFRVLKGLYTSGLPVSDVRMSGTFPMGRQSPSNPGSAVIVFMTRATAARIAWKRIDRSNEIQVWRALTYVHVDPRFG